MAHRKITISGIRGASHLIYLSAWLRTVLDDPDAEATVRIVEHSARPLPMPLDPLFEISDRLQRVDAHPSSPAPHDYVSIGTPGIKPWVRLRIEHRRDRLRAVAIDEGLGSYATWRQRRRAIVREGGSEPWATVRSLAADVSGRFLADERWRLHRRTNAGWELNERIAAEFRCAAPPRSPSDDVVYLTQPWVGLGAVEVSDYLSYLHEAARHVEHLGLRFRVRPHPAERLELYDGFNLAPGRGPAEFDADVINARTLVGESTTALLNMAAIHGSQAIQLRGPLPQFTSEWLSDDQRALFAHYLGGPISLERLSGRLVGQRVGSSAPPAEA